MTKTSIGVSKTRMSSDTELGNRPRRRPGGRSSRVRHAILSAAKRLLAEDALTDITMTDLAKAAGVSYTTVSRGWEDLRYPIAMLRAVQLMDRVDSLMQATVLDPLAAWTMHLSESLAFERLGSHELLDFLQALDAVARLRLQELLRRSAIRGITYPRTDEILVKLVAPIVYSRLVSNGSSATKCVEGCAAPSH